MFISYPDLGSAKPSSWFCWNENNDVIAHNKAYCHANMASDGLGWNEMITAVPKDDELSLEYLRMLVRGPFCSMADLIKLDRVGKHYYLHLLSLNKWPANVLMNFCIASRIPIEFHYLLSAWAKRCEAGFDPTLAFLLTTSYGGNHLDKQNTERTFHFFRNGHMWLDPASKWSDILTGSFNAVSKPFSTHPQDCRPTNIIWGHCNDHLKLATMSDEEIAAYYTQPVLLLEPPKPPMPKPGKKVGQYIINHGLLHDMNQVAIQHQMPAPAPAPWAFQIAGAQPQPFPPDFEDEMIDEEFPLDVEDDEEDDDEDFD